MSTLKPMRRPAAKPNRQPLVIFAVLFGVAAIPAAGVRLLCKPPVIRLASATHLLR